MPDTNAAPARVCLLDDGYSREARSLLYNAYRHEPTFAYIFEAQRPGYERRLRVMVREWVRQHFYLQLPAIGLLVEDRLIALALIVPPLRRLGVADSWAWRLRMILGTACAARGATWTTRPHWLPACPPTKCMYCRCWAYTRSFRVSTTVSNCYKRCTTGARTTLVPRVWCWTPETSITWPFTSVRVMRKLAKWL